MDSKRLLGLADSPDGLPVLLEGSLDRLRISVDLRFALQRHRIDAAIEFALTDRVIIVQEDVGVV